MTGPAGGALFEKRRMIAQAAMCISPSLRTTSTLKSIGPLAIFALLAERADFRSRHKFATITKAQPKV